MPKPVNVHALGLWSFANLTTDPTNSMCLRLRFATKVTDRHKAEVLDAFHAWMVAQKMIADNGGKPISPQDVIAKMALNNINKAEDTSGGDQ